MEELIGLLLVVSPGFLVRKIKDSIFAKDEVKTDVENTIVSILYSIPILIINLIIVRFICKTPSIKDVILKFDSVEFILKYSLLTVITTMIFSNILIKYLYNKNNIILNKLRKKVGESERTTSINPWQDFFKTQDEMPIRILKNKDIISEGFVKHWDVDGLSDKDIVLEHSELMKDNPQCFTKVKKTYYNFKSDIVIQELYFDESLLNNE